MPPRSSDSRKCFGQICTVARALDVVGDRWTLLILRELLGGPARFNELQEGLPGIAKNLLTERLRRLEADGLVRRASSTQSTGYALTDLGASTRPIVEALGMWGGKAPRLGALDHERSVRSVAVALHTFLSRAGDALPEDSRVVELMIDDEPLEIVVGTRPTVTARPSADPDARMRTTASSMRSYLHGQSFDPDDFPLVSGDGSARSALLKAMEVFF